MKSILLHVDADQCFEARKQAALDLARSCSGHITCLLSVSYEVFASGDSYGSAIAAAMPPSRLMGGVTRQVLSDPYVPVLLAD